MTGIQLANIIAAVGQFYFTLIFAYVLLSWFPVRGILFDIQHVLASLVEPYLSIFRRIVPPVGMMDFSPIVAILALQLLLNYLIIPLVARL